MRRGLACVALALAWPMPAVGQDVLGPVNPVDYTPAMGMHAAVEAQAQRLANRRGHARTATSRTAQTCANAARMRARGSGDPRLVRLRQLCRQAGY